MTAAPSPTSQWLAVVPDMPPLEGPAGTAERLLLLLHYGIDWTGGWVAGYRTRYWDQILPDRVVTSTFRADNLRRWWSEVSAELEAEPRNKAERVELEQLLREEPLPVLTVLRTETEALILRVRIIAETRRTTQQPDL